MFLYFTHPYPFSGHGHDNMVIMVFITISAYHH